MLDLEIVDVTVLLVLDDLEARIAVVVLLPLQAARVEQVVGTEAHDEIAAEALLDIGFEVAFILLEFLFPKKVLVA